MGAVHVKNHDLVPDGAFVPDEVWVIYLLSPTNCVSELVTVIVPIKFPELSWGEIENPYLVIDGRLIVPVIV